MKLWLIGVLCSIAGGIVFFIFWQLVEFGWQTSILWALCTIIGSILVFLGFAFTKKDIEMRKDARGKSVTYLIEKVHAHLKWTSSNEIDGIYYRWKYRRLISTYYQCNYNPLISYVNKYLREGPSSYYGMDMYPPPNLIEEAVSHLG